MELTPRNVCPSFIQFTPKYGLDCDKSSGHASKHSTKVTVKVMDKEKKEIEVEW